MEDKNKGLSKVTESSVPSNQWVMVFEVTTGVGKDLTKKTYRVNKQRLIVGSALSSDIRIQQNAVSNLHAVIEFDETGKPVVYDMASETGVFLNDKKIVSESLKDGDELKVGFASLKFHLLPVQEAQSLAPKETVKTTTTQKLFYDQKEDFRPLILEDERNVIQIFDYPGANEHSLQVVEYWGDVILDVRHITEQTPVNLGEGKDASFLVPNFHTPFPFISFENGAAVVQIPEKATGVIRAGKQLVPLEKLDKTRVQLKASDLAKIRVGDITFYVSYAPVPPHLRRQRAIERDPLYFKIWFSSLLLTLALVAVILKTEAPKPLEVDELPPRVTSIIFKPEVPPPPVVKPKIPEKKVEVKPEVKEPEPPKEEPKKKAEPPKTLPTETKDPNKKANADAKQNKQAQKADSKKNGTPRNKAGGDAGEGKRAAGEEGKKGKPNKPKAPIAQVESKGNPSAIGAQKSATNNGKGNVEALFDDIQGSISQKLAASGKGASAAGERLRGYGGFTSEGNGGLGNLGSGKGGGGESQSLSQGLGTKGLGEGAQGKGLGAIGSGGNLLGTGRGRPSVEVGGTTETIIMGGLDRSVIDEIIRKHWNQITYCYVKELNASSKPIRGRVLTRFVISGTGRVTQAGVETTSMQNPSVERCLLGVLQKIVFPEPAGGGIVEVSYPFAFTPAVEN